MITCFSVLANFFYLLLTSQQSTTTPLGVGAADYLQSGESVHGWAARALALGYTTILVLWQQRGSLYNKVAPHHSACFPGICRENIFPVRYAVVRETQPHAHFAWDAGVSEAVQQSTDRIRFSLELETAIQLQCHIDYWNCLSSSAFICFWWFE